MWTSEWRISTCYARTSKKGVMTARAAQKALQICRLPCLWAQIISWRYLVSAENKPSCPGVLYHPHASFPSKAHLEGAVVGVSQHSSCTGYRPPGGTCAHLCHLSLSDWLRLRWMQAAMMTCYPSARRRNSLSYSTTSYVTLDKLFNFLPCCQMETMMSTLQGVLRLLTWGRCKSG